MAEVIELDLVTRLDIPVERVLRKASEAGLTQVVVIGYDKDDDFYAAASMADGGDVLWLLELCKRKLFEAADSLTEDAS